MVNETNVESQSANFTPLGEVLLSARKAKKLSQNDISNSLRISIKQIDAIEKNEFSVLPEPVITRGFIRNYAKLLGVEVEPLLASYQARMPEPELSALSVKTTTRQVMSKQDNRSWLKYILGSILALLLVLAWFFYMDYAPESTITIKENSTKASDTITPLPLPEVALPSAERQNLATATETSDISSNATQSAEMPAMPTQSGTSVAQALSPTVTQEVSINPPENHKLSMSFTDKTWVSIKNSAGKVVFEKEFNAGETGGYDGEPPLKITIGNAAATKVQYLGQTIDLTSSTKGNVARVKLP